MVNLDNFLLLTEMFSQSTKKRKRAQLGKGPEKKKFKPNGVNMKEKSEIAPKSNMKPGAAKSGSKFSIQFSKPTKDKKVPKPKAKVLHRKGRIAPQSSLKTKRKR